jgi:3',5'-cyclic AMP phosphodiesterase CpdA
MPIQLRPISRREFLARSLAAGAGIMFSHSLFAAGKTTDANSWALLADIHIAADRALVLRGVKMADNFTAVGRELLALPKRPAGVISAGDLAVNKGEPGDYATFNDLLKPLRAADIPVHLVLGNHDDREHLCAAFKGTRPAKPLVPDRHVAILRTRLANWFLLDSQDKTLGVPGSLGEAQRAWLARELDANSKKPTILVAHHDAGEGEGSLQDAKEFLEIIRPRRQVKAYVFGHTHVWKVAQDPSGIHLINLPPVAYVFMEGDPNGWVHATLERDGARLELRCLDPKHTKHGQAFDLKWRAG